MDYQKNTEHIGSSDIGILILSGFERGKGFQLKKLFFGGDGAYSAYIVDGQTQIPDHYELICEFNTWMRLYDDDHFVRKFSADAIRVYRSGDRGCIIQLI